MGKEAFEQVRERTFDQVEALEEKVRANPIAAIGIALEMGAFIGIPFPLFFGPSLIESVLSLLVVRVFEIHR